MSPGGSAPLSPKKTYIEFTRCITESTCALVLLDVAKNADNWILALLYLKLYEEVIVEILDSPKNVGKINSMHIKNTE